MHESPSSLVIGYHACVFLAPMRTLRHVFALAVAAAVALGAVSAGAETAPDRALAESLFQQGRELMDAGEPAAACAKFEESQRLEAAGGTSLNLATCYEALGKTASAWAEFARALALAEREDDAERARFAEEKIQALGLRLSRVIVNPPPSGTTPSLFIDGIELSSSAWSSPLPLDPGWHEIRIEADGHLPWTARVELPRAPNDLVVDAPPLAAAAPSPVEVSEPVAPQKVEREPVAAPVRDSTEHGVPVGLWISAGISVGALAVGTIAALDYRGQMETVDSHCEGRYCDDEGMAADRSARSSARIADVSFAAAAVSGILAGYFWYTMPTSGGVTVGVVVPTAFDSLVLRVGARY